MLFRSNLGHPEVIAMTDLADMMRVALKADPGLIRLKPQPPMMTPVKHPILERQRLLLGVEPRISIAEGVRRVCAFQAELLARETRAAAT